jgi:hypothetical protein
MRHSTTVSASAMRTISRMWKICIRAGSLDGSRRNTYASPVSSVSPPSGSGPRAAIAG